MAHYALQELHIRPSVFAEMSVREKAFLLASMEYRAEQAKKI